MTTTAGCSPDVMPPMVENGFKVVDPGRFDLPANDFSAEISAFKAGNVELLFTVVPGPDFTVFLNQAAQQGLKPKIISAGKVDAFPQGVYPYGDRAINFLTAVWWSRYHPYRLAYGQSSMEYATEYEKSTSRQASMALGFRHSLIEAAVDTLRRSQKIDDPASIRDALRGMDYKSIVGPINFKAGPFPNTSESQCVAGQSRKARWPLDLLVVDNTLAPISRPERARTDDLFLSCQCWGCGGRTYPHRTVALVWRPEDYRQPGSDGRGGRRRDHAVLTRRHFARMAPGTHLNSPPPQGRRNPPSNSPTWTNSGGSS